MLWPFNLFFDNLLPISFFSSLLVLILYHRLPDSIKNRGVIITDNIQLQQIIPHLLAFIFGFGYRIISIFTKAALMLKDEGIRSTIRILLYDGFFGSIVFSFCLFIAILLISFIGYLFNMILRIISSFFVENPNSIVENSNVKYILDIIQILFALFITGSIMKVTDRFNILALMLTLNIDY